MPTRLRVLHLIDGLGHGGAERLLSDLAEGAAHADLDINVAALYPKDGQESAAALARAGVQAELIGAGGLLDPRSVWRVRSAIKRAQPDLVHTHLGYSDILGSLAAATTRHPVVSTVHVTDWFQVTSAREKAKAHLAATARRRLVQRVIAVSEAAKQAYPGHRSGRDGEISVVHNGILGNAAPGAGAAVRRELSIPPDRLVIATLSVLRSGKGHAQTIEALRLVRKVVPEAMLLVIGDGPSRDEIERSVSDLHGSVVFAGHRTDVMQVLDAADLLVHLSSQDALPTSLLEAMAAGLPILATDVGGIPEVVTDGTSGVLLHHPVATATVATTIVDLLQDRERRSRLAASARDRFESHFRADQWALRLRSLYEQVLAARSR